MRFFTGSFLTGIAAVLLNGCTNIFLQPDRTLHLNPDSVGVRWEGVHFPSRDGVDLTGLWFVAAGTSPAKGVVVQFHGNGENMTSHFLYAYWLVFDGWSVMTFDYRGYGSSGGRKSIPGSIDDSAAALAYARRRAAGLPLVVLGQSLGGAMALSGLDRDGGKGVAAVVLDSTFASYRGVARRKLSEHWLTMWAAIPLSWLISDRYAPERLISSRRRVPLLMLHSRGDPVVPYAQGRRLFERASAPKEFWDVPGAGHLEAFGARGAQFRPRLARFLDESLLK